VEQPGAIAQPILLTAQVPLDPERAFDLFTGAMGTWWPLDAYSRAVNELTGTGVTARSLEFQARLGGEILEHLSDGRVLAWGEVVEWDRPRRVAMAWHPHSLPEPPTLLEVAFAAADPGTLLRLVHGGWDRLSEPFRQAMYPLYAEGWPGTMARFAAAARFTAGR
jgi:uncharacterized protein YndB with AHSA1/START domain